MTTKTKELESLEKYKKAPFRLACANDLKGEIETQWLIDGWLEQETLACLFGERNIHKSYVALTWAYLLAQGTHITDEALVSKKICSLYIPTEARRTVKVRIEAMRQIYKEIEDEMLLIWEDDWDWSDKHIDKFCHHFKYSQMLEGNQRVPKLIIIDSLSQSDLEGTVNSDAVIRQILKQAKKIQDQCRVTVLLIAHSGKNVSKGIMGSAVLGNDIDTEIRVSGKIKPTITLTKQRNGGKDNMVMNFMPYPIHAGTDSKGKDILNLYLEFGDNKLDQFDKNILEAYKIVSEDGLLKEVKKTDVKDALIKIEYPIGFVPSQKVNQFRSKFNRRTNKLVSSGYFKKRGSDPNIMFSERIDKKGSS